ncbi:hypothetical protein LTR56_012384 [Elasticomyces elasticus]|nr:hypothetical protein LTR56_012384 [Elasticomyces elasticus]KAK3652344.1 hypothetical protein LTR22_011698 [Elasticomyces elasticus]KAK4919002.1 hypothetical protein LTR49_013319 [Elasticomyces elasticus]KAK5756647.1 hypothetical protein LTS12_013237 [Elasticomyces elasticus]
MVPGVMASFNFKQALEDRRRTFAASEPKARDSAIAHPQPVKVAIAKDYGPITWPAANVLARSYNKWTKVDGQMRSLEEHLKAAKLAEGLLGDASIYVIIDGPKFVNPADYGEHWAHHMRYQRDARNQSITWAAAGAGQCASSGRYARERRTDELRDGKGHHLELPSNRATPSLTSISGIRDTMDNHRR